MTWKRTALAGLTLLMLIMVYVLDIRLAEKAIYIGVNQSSLASGIKLDDVIEIRLKNPAGETVLTREPKGSWRIKSPIDAAADPEIVDQLLINVTGARKRNEIDVKNLAEFGLAAPEISLGIKTSTGRNFELLVGNDSTYTGQVFGKYPNSSKVFTMGDHVKSVLVRAPMDFRRARLVDVDVADLPSYSKITIQTPKSAVSLQNQNGQWQIISPVQAPAEGDVVNDFLQKAGLLRASSFLSASSDKPTSIGAAMEALKSNPVLAMTLERTTGPLVRVTVGNAGESSKPIYVAQRLGDNEIIVIRQETVDAINQDENYFRSRSLLSMRPEDVGLFSIEIGRARTDLVRNDKGQWEFVGDPNRRVSNDQVNSRLEALLRTKIRDYVEANPTDPSAYGLLPPHRKFTLTSRDKKRTEVLELGRSEAGRVTSVYARRKGDPSVFTMEASPELVILPELVADKRFARTDIDSIDHFDFDLGEKRYALKHEKGEWKLLKPTQTAYSSVDNSKVERVLDMLNVLEYEKDFGATGERVITSFDGAPMTLRLYDDKNNELLNFALGKRLQATSFVSTGKGKVFEVKNPDLDRLQAAIQSLIQ